jgi:hypothetical protein
MANWLNPTITTQYDVFVAEAKDRDVDAGTMFLNPPTNQPVGSVRFNRTTKIFEEWSGTAWVALVIGIAGGGTGAGTSGGAVAGLGLGSMAFQNSNNVNITGGSILDITAARVAAILHPLTDNVYDLGFLNQRWRTLYLRSGLVIPVGVDKYVVG